LKFQACYIVELAHKTRQLPPKLKSSFPLELVGADIGRFANRDQLVIKVFGEPVAISRSNGWTIQPQMRVAMGIVDETRIANQFPGS